MFNPLFPRQADNAYRGYKLALWLFALLVLMKAGIGLNSILNGHFVATTADGIPLDTFTPPGAQTVVSLFAILGLSQLMICLVGLLVLVRYRAMIPFMFTLLLLEHLSRRLILAFLPVPRVGTPPGFIVNLVLLALMIAGLALSIRRRDDRQRRTLRGVAHGIAQERDQGRLENVPRCQALTATNPFCARGSSVPAPTLRRMTPCRPAAPTF